jgi:hypothetical protein
MGKAGLERRMMTEEEHELVRFAKNFLDGKSLSLVISILTHLTADVLLAMSGESEAVFDENLAQAVEAIKGNKMFIQAAGATKQ